MRVPQFEYFAPNSIEEACSFLRRASPGRLRPGRRHGLAGQDEDAEGRAAVPAEPEDDSRVGCHYLSRKADGLRIGALATIQAIKNSPVVQRRCKILAQAAAVESSVQIRNLATLGGNIANASPAADAPLALMAAGATVVACRGRRRTRESCWRSFSSVRERPCCSRAN